MDRRVWVLGSKAIALVAALVWLRTENARAEAGQGSATFVALGPAGLRIEGATDQATLSATDKLLVVTVDLSSLKTGIEVRDRHLREDLEVVRFPTAVLTVQRVDLKLPEPFVDCAGEADGELALHGQKQRIHFSYRARRSSNGIEVAGSLRIHLADFGIAPRKYLGIGIQPDVDAAVLLGLTP